MLSKLLRVIQGNIIVIQPLRVLNGCSHSGCFITEILMQVVSDYD